MRERYGVAHKTLTVPNVVTVLRMVMAIAGLWFAMNHAPRGAFALCVFAAALDAFDGWYARRFRQVTHLGEHLDPLADKLLVGVIFAVLAWRIHSAVVWSLVAMIAVREVGMTAFRSYSLHRHKRFIPANTLGKIKMIVQSVFGLFVLGLMVVPHQPPRLSLPIAAVAIGIILAVSWVSAGVYVRNWRLVELPCARPDNSNEPRKIAAG